MKVIFRYNFTQQTSKTINYSNSKQFKMFLFDAILMVKRNDTLNGVSGKDLRKRGRKIKSKA